MTDQRLLAGTAIVTGGGSGLGRAISLSLADGGAAVAVVDLLADGGTETVQRITKAGGKAAFIPADVSRWDDVDRAVGDAVRQLGPLGIIVNAAGVLDGVAEFDPPRREVAYPAADADEIVELGRLAVPDRGLAHHQAETGRLQLPADPAPRGILCLRPPPQLLREPGREGERFFDEFLESANVGVDLDRPLVGLWL